MQIFTAEELLKSQLDQVPLRKSTKSKPVEPSASTGITYNARLQEIISDIKKEIDAEVYSKIKALEFDYTQDSNFSDSWYDVITRAIDVVREKISGVQVQSYILRIASSFVSSADNQNYKRMQKSLSPFGINVLSDQNVSDYLDTAIRDNVRLIKKMESDYLDQVETVVTNAMRSGLTPAKIAKELQNQLNISRNRAKLIAVDQTNKVNSGLTRRRMKASGIAYFQWITSKDERVRNRHNLIANAMTKYGRGIYAYDDPPKNEKGIPILPGEEVRCRCVARPVIQSEIDDNKNKGNVKK